MKPSIPAQGRYVLVAEEVLPEVFGKVLQAKELLETHQVRNISAAVRRVELSRSAFYKYKDSVFPARNRQSILTLQATLVNEPGTLQSLLAQLSQAGADVVTIHQQKPRGDEAQVTLTVNTAGMKEPLRTVMDRIAGQPFVRTVEVSEE